MTRVLIVVILLLALALGCLVGAGVAVGKTQTAVEYAETPIYGDRAAADGLRIAVGQNCGRYLLWDTTLFFDGAETKAESDFRFVASQARQVREFEPAGLQLWYELIGGMSYGSGSGSDEGKTADELRAFWDENPTTSTMAPLLLDAIAQAGAGETRLTVLRLRDYYEYFPVEHSMALKDLSGNAWTENIQAVRDFFRIPVPETFCMSFAVTKNADGRVLALSWYPGKRTLVDASGSAVAAASADMAWGTVDDGTQVYPEPIGVSAVTADWCFFAFSDYDATGRCQIDASAIPGGLGVYRLPWSWDERYDGHSTYDASRLKTVFPLPEEEPVLALGADEKGRPLLVTASAGQMFLTVLDQTGETAVQSVALGAFSGEAGWTVELQVFDGWLLLEDAFGGYAVAEQDADGLWQAALRTGGREDDARAAQTEIPSGSSAFAWDGTRLAVAEGVYDPNGGGGSFLLSLLNVDDLIYLARFDGSLNVPPAEEYRYSIAVEEGVGGTGGLRMWFT